MIVIDKKCYNLRGEINGNKNSNLRIIVYPHKGSLEIYEDAIDVHERPIQYLKVNDCIGNEVYKNFEYLTTKKKRFLDKLIADVQQNGIESISPIRALKHPLVENKYVILNGNHRLGAYRIGNIPQIKAVVLNTEDIFLSLDKSFRDDTTLKIITNPNVAQLKEATTHGLKLETYFNCESWPLGLS
jgi:hypothetical protein